MRFVKHRLDFDPPILQFLLPLSNQTRLFLLAGLTILDGRYMPRPTLTAFLAEEAVAMDPVVVVPR